MPSSETAPDSSGAETSGAPRKRGWLFVFLILFFVVLPILLAVSNGTGFRTLVQIGVVKAAACEGLAGGLKVEGTLWSGFSLSSVEFDGGDRNPSLFQIEEASLRYRGLDLIRSAAPFNWLDALVIRKAALVIPLPETLEKQDEPAMAPAKRKKAKATSTDFSPLWNLLASDVEIEDLSIDLLTGKGQVTITHLNLRSVPGENGSLQISRIAFPGSSEITDIHAKISKGERCIEIAAMSPLPLLSLNSLYIEEPTPGKFEGGVLLDIAGGILEGSLRENWQIALNLKPGSAIDLSRIELDHEKPLELAGIASALDLRFTGDFGNPRTWSINGKIRAEGRGWEKYTTDVIDLTIAENRLQLEASRADTTLNANLSAPFQEAEPIFSSRLTRAFSNRSERLPSPTFHRTRSQKPTKKFDKISKQPLSAQRYLRNLLLGSARLPSMRASIMPPSM